MKAAITLSLVLLAAFGTLKDDAPPKVRKLADGLQFTEGPVWLPKDRALVFSDIPQSKLFRWSATSGLSVYREDSKNTNGNLLDLDGRLLSCRHGTRDLIRTEADGTNQVLASHFDGKRLNSPNDVTIQSDGTLWFTDPPWGLDKQTEGKELDGHWVFRLDAEGRLDVVLKDHVMPNGIALSPDEDRLYVADTGGHRSHPDPAVHGRPATITAYAIDDEGDLVSDPVWTIETRCDGMCIDTRGRLYATGESGITIWTADGEAAGEIPTPEQPANACFGGEAYSTLFITARTSLYCVDLDVAGAKPRGAKW